MPPRIRYTLYFLALALALAGHYVWRKNQPAPPDHRVLSRTEAGVGKPGTVEILSSAYKIDRIYKSMQGPVSVQDGLQISTGRGADETLLLTGVESEVVEATSLAPLSPEFFCHANLTLASGSASPDQHNAGFTPATHADWRLFTLVPGRLGMQLPEGFGVPVKNGTRLDYLTMVLNQNAGVPEQDIRIRTRIHYAPAGPGMRALFRRAAYIYLAHEETPDAGVAADPHAHAGEKCGEACTMNQRSASPSLFADISDPILRQHPGASCCIENASTGGILPQFGSNNTIHWMVPPGQHRYTTEVTKQLNLPYDTRAHYITGHLHPTGVRLRLLEKATQKTVAEICSRDFTDKTGVADMTELRSPEGILLRKDTAYELEAEYDNKTGQPIDAMAILYLYLAEDPASATPDHAVASKP